LPPPLSAGKHPRPSFQEINEILLPSCLIKFTSLFLVQVVWNSNSSPWNGRPQKTWVLSDFVSHQIPPTSYVPKTHDTHFFLALPLPGGLCLPPFNV
jgi:hypothetical protein